MQFNVEFPRQVINFPIELHREYMLSRVPELVKFKLMHDFSDFKIAALDLDKISKSLLLEKLSIWIMHVTKFSLHLYFARTDLQDLLRTNEWQFPNYNEDLVGAMAALYRLQDTYNISSVDMINNNMPGKQNKN